MPLAPIDDKGTVLFFEDSGPPEGSGCEDGGEVNDYDTLVFVHGLVFHGAIFAPLLPYARAHHTRLIRVNTRDYPLSSPFSPTELAALRVSSPEQVRRLGEELAAFLVYLSEHCGIPEITSGVGRKRRKGGMTVVAWSLGNLTMLSMLGNASRLPEKTRCTLERYLRTAVMYDPTITLVGGTPPKGAYYPLRDASLSYEERCTAFCRFVSFYFERVEEDAEGVEEEAVVARRALHDLPLVEDRDRDVRPTVDRMTSEQYASVADEGVTNSEEGRSYAALRLITRETHAENVRRALVDTEGALRGVDVLHLWCDESVGDCVWAVRHVSELVKEEARKSEGEGRVRVRRKVEFARLRGVNHFAHWDDPEQVMRVLVEKLT